MQAGYQITQQRLPLAVDGQVNFAIFDWKGNRAPSQHVVRIKQIQLEHDSGKSLHDDENQMSLVDLNRTGKKICDVAWQKGGLCICDSTYQNVPVVGRLDFELWGCKVKISQNIVPKLILRFHIFWNFQYLIFKLLEGFGAKTMFLCKNGPLNCPNTNILCRFPKF